MAEYAIPKYGVALKFDVGLVDQSNTKLLKSNPTLAAGDVKWSKDDGSLNNLTTLPYSTNADKRVEVPISATEMQCAKGAAIFSDAAGSEWCDQLVSILTTAGDPGSMWTTALTESYAADGAAPTAAQALFLIQQMLTEFAISGTTLTIKKVDGSSTAAVCTMDSATTPTSLTRTS